MVCLFLQGPRVDYLWPLALGWSLLLDSFAELSLPAAVDTANVLKSLRMVRSQLVFTS
jgi:hypothetical protein